MTNRVKIWVSLLAIVIIGITAHNSSPRNDLRKTDEEAILQGKKFASHIWRGETSELVWHSDADIIAGLKESPLPSMLDRSNSEVVEFEALPRQHHLLTPFHSNFVPPESEMRLTQFERSDGILVLTFLVWHDQSRVTFISQDKEPLVIAVAVRYVNPDPDSVFRDWMRRVVNISWMPDEIRTIASGYWMLIDYRYNFNLREHYDWIKTNEKRLNQESKNQESESLKWLESLTFPAWNESIAADLDRDYQWASDVLNTRKDHVMQQQKQLSESNTSSVKK